MVTIKDIDAARAVVMHSTKPEIDRLLAEAQLLLDEKVQLTSQIEQKVPPPLLDLPFLTRFSLFL